MSCWNFELQLHSLQVSVIELHKSMSRSLRGEILNLQVNNRTIAHSSDAAFTEVRNKPLRLNSLAFFSGRVVKAVWFHFEICQLLSFKCLLVMGEGIWNLTTKSNYKFGCQIDSFARISVYAIQAIKTYVIFFSAISANWICVLFK